MMTRLTQCHTNFLSKARSVGVGGGRSGDHVIVIAARAIKANDNGSAKYLFILTFKMIRHIFNLQRNILSLLYNFQITIPKT